MKLAFRVIVICLSRCAANGRESEIDAEGEGGVGKRVFEFVDHASEVLRGVAETAYDAEAAGVGDGGGERGGGGVGHAG